MKSIKNFFCSIGRFFKDFGVAVVKGDIWVKLSLLIMGAGYFGRKQYVKGVLMTALQAVLIAFTVLFGLPYIGKFDTLGDVRRESVYDPALRKNVVNDYDHSFKILLFGLISIIVIIVAVVIWIRNVVSVRKLQMLAENGKHINTFREDVREFRNGKFHITLLSLPVSGIVCFTIIPLIVIILVAFTSYNKTHMPPAELFTWVGFDNFEKMFSSSLTTTFNYSFGKVLSWTLIWAVTATATTYIGGILLSMFLNNSKTKLPKMWRTFFVIAIAVPQFVSLLLVRNFFADMGIVNTICSNLGITDFLKEIGLVRSSLDHIPFLTDPTWAKFTIIIINIWVGVPYLMLIATGVLMNIPTDLTEAARIDGANGFQIFRKITMPYMLFVTGPYLVTQFVGNINNFNVIYLLTNDVYITLDQKLANSTSAETDLLVTWLFKLTQNDYNYNMASVIGILVFIICAVFTLVAFNFMIKGDREEDFQ